MTQAFNLSQLANSVNSSGKLSLSAGTTGTLPVANGGTGLTSSGAAGNILQSNGTAWQSVAAALYTGARGQAFTSSGTFTIPTGVTSLKVTLTGGGGGGAGYGGTSGATAIKYLTNMTPGNTIIVTVGAGSTAYNTNGFASSIASGTQVISTVTAGGGFQATSGTAVASGGDVNLSGGSPFYAYEGTTYWSTGGGSIWGGRGLGSSGPNSYGCGGNVDINLTTTRGYQGIVLFEW